MASFQFHYRPSTRGKEYTGHLFIRVIHSRRSLSITTPFTLYPKEWDKRKKQIVYNIEDISRLFYLKSVESGIEKEYNILNSIINQFEEYSKYSVEDVVKIYRQRKLGVQLTAYVEKLSGELIGMGRYRTARAYHTVCNGLISFTGKKDLSLKVMNISIIEAFEKSMHKEGKSLNTISFYMRNLRAIYNKAIHEHLLEPYTDNPFNHVYTSIPPTRKRALSREEMTQINNLDVLQEKESEKSQFLSHELSTAHRFFLFSFHARGMSFVDLSFLKKTDIRDGVLYYNRRKTGTPLAIKLSASMRHIINSFKNETEDSIYLFPIIKRKDVPEYLQYESALRVQNYRLKRLASIYKIHKPMSTHVARHTWATIAKGISCPLAVISESLGHRSEKTTAIYLASFEHHVLDRVSEKVAKAVKRSEWNLKNKKNELPLWLKE